MCVQVKRDALVERSMGKVHRHKDMGKLHRQQAYLAAIADRCLADR